MDQFLDFWSAHNITIIEGLIALVLVLAAFTSYRLIFSQDGENAAGGGANTADLEKTLQKILEGQKGVAGAGPGAGATSAAATAEAEEMKLQLKAREGEIEALKAQLASAQAQAAPTPEGGAEASTVVGAAASLSSEERSGLENKIHDLEARLAEYEIISEDIADLSRYKEENATLQQELTKLKGGAPAEATTVTTPTPAPAPVVEAAPTAPESAAPVAASPAPEPEAPKATPAATAAEVPPAEAAPAQAAAPAPAADENLMNEFAAAIEGQKPAPLPGETDKLMTEFENFVKKG